MKNKKIILASGSKARLQLLQNAGINVRAAASGVDENALKRRGKATGKSVGKTALTLARAKAEKISAQFPGTLIIGADQMLECKKRWLDKAGNAKEARAQLAFLSGKTHRLVTATVLMRGKKIIWENVSEVKLTVRKLSRNFIKGYVRKLGKQVLAGVGCYQLEGLGSQLFQRIDGDYFMILGLNLLPLMAALRAQGALD